MSVDVLDCTISLLTDTAALQKRWRALEARCDTPFFLSWDWMGPWLSLVRSPLFLCEVRQSGEDVGLAVLGVGRQRHGPFTFQTLYLNQSGDLDEDQVFIEYNGILCAETHRSEVWVSLLECLTTFQARLPAPMRSWSLLRLAGLHFAPREIEAGGGLVNVTQESQEAYLIDLGAARKSPDGYLGSLSANTRRQILRSRRILEEEGDATFHLAGVPDQVKDWLPKMASLQSLWFTRKGKSAALSRPFFYDFVKRLILENLKSGSVELVQCRAGDQVFGYLVNLRSGDQIYSYQSAFTQYSDNKIKPGLVCHTMLAEHYMSDGAQCYNLLAGDGQYKKSLSNTTQSLSWVSFAVPTFRVKVFMELRRLLRR